MWSILLLWIGKAVLAVVPLLLYIAWDRLIKNLDKKIEDLKIERCAVVDNKSESYQQLTKEIEKMYAYDKILRPSNKFLNSLGVFYIAVSITLTAVAAIGIVIIFLNCAVDRYDFNRMDTYASKYAAIPAERLQTTIIHEAEELNDKIVKSGFITDDEKRNVTRIDTQGMWKKFLDRLDVEPAKLVILEVTKDEEN